MKSDRVILIALPLVAVAIGLWVLVISPKKNEAADLKDQAATLQSDLEAAEGDVASGEAARRAFPKNYGELVSLGAAAPEDDDQATLVYNLSRLGTKTGMRFDVFKLDETAASSTPSTAAATTTSPTGETATATGEAAPAEGTTDTGSTADSGTTAAAAPVAPAPATESSAATLPIGATVGSAGLPVMAYGFELTGDFFDATDYLAGLDDSVRVSGKSDKPVVHGRLLTIDGFAFDLEQLDDFPMIHANFSVTSYLVPADQGLEAGATPAGPAPAGTPVPSTTVTSTPETAAAVTP